MLVGTVYLYVTMPTGFIPSQDQGFMFGILLVGVAGYRALPVSDLPNVDYPTIWVQVNLPGANPDTMAAAVAAHRIRCVP